MEFLLPVMGFFTGLIDSVVGGGGLISLPTLSIVLSPGAHAIGTNKIVGTVGAATALFVYARKGHLRFKEGILFCLVCVVGSFLGSSAAPYASKEFFKYLLIFMCPVILWIVFNKEKYFVQKENYVKPKMFIFLLSALASGFYDGFFGPGGGTFMFLSLFVGTGLPLMEAIAISKLANTFSATTALATYAHNGFVHWKTGALMAIGMLIGSFIGAKIAIKSADKIVRPMLLVIVTLLMIKVIGFE